MTPSRTPLVYAVAAAISIAAGVSIATGARAQGCAQIEVHNVRAEQGMVLVAAYTDAADFTDRKPASAIQQRATAAPTMNVSVCGLAGASVALLLYQDLNGNGKLDTNAFGVPGEPWGASGKPSGFGPPTWEATQVPLDGKPIVVQLSK